MNSSELGCSELVEIITDYLEGQLSAAERTEFERHLSECPGCEAYLRQMQSVVRTLSGTSLPEMPGEIKARLMAAFRGWSRRD